MRTLYPILLFLIFCLPAALHGQVEDDVVVMDEDATATFSVTDNDVAPGLDVSTVDLDPSTPGEEVHLNRPGIGLFDADESGNVTFTPALNFFGSVTQSYGVSNGSGVQLGEAQIQITVNPVNDMPVAADDAGTTDENTPVSIDVTANDTDVEDASEDLSADLDPITDDIQLSWDAVGEGLWTASGGTVTFTPVSGFSGTAQLIYTAWDLENGESNQATISVTVTDVNANPVAVDDAATTLSDTPVTIAVLDNDTDDDNALNETSVDLDPSVAGRQASVSVGEGTATVDDAGIVTFTPSGGATGQANFDYTVNDDAGNTSNTATVTVTINSVNSPPTAANDEGNTSEGTDVSFDLVGNDTDSDGSIDPASVDLDPDSPGQQTSFAHANGSATVDNTGMFTFVPDAGFVGAGIIDYTVNVDDGAISNVAEITVNVSAGNQAPVAVNDEINGTEDTSFTFDLLANDTDDNQIDAASVDLNPASNGQQTSLSVDGGTITVNASGVISYTPLANYNGGFTFDYSVQDDQGQVSNTATVSVTIAAVNDAPVAVNDAGNTTEQTPVSFNVTANDTDIDGTVDPASIDLDVSVAGIQNRLTNGDGNWTVDG